MTFLGPDLRTPEQKLQDQYIHYTAEFDKTHDRSDFRIVVPLAQIIEVLKIVEYWTEVKIHSNESNAKVTAILEWITEEQGLRILEDFAPMDLQVVHKLRDAKHMKKVIEYAYRYPDECTSDWFVLIKNWTGPARNNITTASPPAARWSGWNYNDTSFFFKDPGMAMLFKLKWI